MFLSKVAMVPVLQGHNRGDHLVDHVNVGSRG